MGRLLSDVGHEHRVADAAQLGGRGALPAGFSFHGFKSPERWIEVCADSIDLLLRRPARDGAGESGSSCFCFFVGEEAEDDRRPRRRVGPGRAVAEPHPPLAPSQRRGEQVLEPIEASEFARRLEAPALSFTRSPKGKTFWQVLGFPGEPAEIAAEARRASQLSNKGLRHIIAGQVARCRGNGLSLWSDFLLHSASN